MIQGITDTPTCHACPLVSLCLPANLNPSEITQLENIVQERRKIKRHAHIFRAGDAFKYLYIIRSGSLKSYTISTEGCEYVNSFNYSAECLGFDGLAQGKHTVSAVALEESVVCVLPFEPLLLLASTIPALQRQLFHMIGQHMSSLFNIKLNSHAETRFASFLLDMSHRSTERGLDSQDLTLSMSREEIGNYLGLATETISRLFHGFERRGILAADRRSIHLNDLYALQALSLE